MCVWSSYIFQAKNIQHRINIASNLFIEQSIEKTWLGIMQKVCLTIFQLEACWIYPSLGNGNTWMAWGKCIRRKKGMDAMFILFQVPLINKNGTKSMHCIIRGKFVISPCRKSALFWIHAVILLFHAEILPCGPPLLPHSCAEPFLGVMQKYSFLGDIYTSDYVPKMQNRSSRNTKMQLQNVPAWLYPRPTILLGLAALRAALA